MARKNGKKKPGDLGHLGLTDPLSRDVSAYNEQARTFDKDASQKGRKEYQARVKSKEPAIEESARRQFRQSEDAGAKKKNGNGKSPTAKKLEGKRI